MKRFGTAKLVPYIGQPQGIPMSLNAPSREQPKSVSLFFDWASYGIGPSTFTPVPITKIFTAGGVNTVPSDYQSKGAVLHLIGAGSSGGANTAGNSGRSGGGGSYAGYNEPPLIPGGTFGSQLGVGGVGTLANVAQSGTDTWVRFDGTLVAPTNIFEGALAKAAVNENGGVTATSIGHTLFAGGNGRGSAGTGGGEGGAGSAGPNGVGRNGGNGNGGVPQGAGGGAGCNGGLSTIGVDGGANGGAGGLSRAGNAGGIGGVGAAGGAGSNGSGGGGGGAGQFNGGANSVDALWTDTLSGVIRGPASGPGGGGSSATTPGAPGTFSANGCGNGGASAGRSSAGTQILGNNGGQGAIVLTYFSTSQVTAAELLVQVNLQQGVVNPIDRIVAVNIDNTDSNITVYVRFPDSGQTIACAPGAIVYETAITQDLKCQVLAEGFTGFVNQPQTLITFSNRYIAPQTDYEQQTVRPQVLGSVLPNSAVLNQSKFRYLAVGDLMWCDWIEIDGLATPGGIFVDFTSAIPVSGFYLYITDLTIFIQHSVPETANLRGCNVNFTDASGVLNYRIPYLAEMAVQSREILNLKNSQIKLPASSKITLARTPLLTKSGSVVAFPTEYCLASVIMNYSIVDERNAE